METKFFFPIKSKQMKTMWTHKRQIEWNDKKTYWNSFPPPLPKNNNCDHTNDLNLYHSFLYRSSSISQWEEKAENTILIS